MVSPLSPRSADLKAPEEVEGLPGLMPADIDKSFKEIDCLGNSFIGVSELRVFLCTMGERPSEAELDEMIRMVDLDGDGKVSYEAFLSLFSPESPVLAEMVSTAYQSEDEKVLQLIGQGGVE